MFRSCGDRLQPRTSPPFERPEGRFFLFILLISATAELARLDRDKANNIPRMHGGAFGSAWIKLQLRQAALAVRLLASFGPSLLSLSLFS
jgi:hypothetical protein